VVAAAGSDVVISVVGDDTDSRAVWMGESGALAGLAAGAIAVESSTLSLGWVRELRGLVEARGAELVDAPLTGSKDAAQAGKLTVLIGATPEMLERLRPILSSYAATIVHLGPPGSGAAYKLVNNMLVAAQVAAAGEALALAEKLGLDMSIAGPTLASGAAGSPSVKGKMAAMLSHDHHDRHFALRWMNKDVVYALRAAEETGMSLPVTEAARAQFERAMTSGFADLDFSAIAEVPRAAR
jgi:3-hydroxyisobutyrate dehydrogenase